MVGAGKEKERKEKKRGLSLPSSPLKKLMLRGGAQFNLVFSVYIPEFRV